MKRDRMIQNHEEIHLDFKKHPTTDQLEISSTGYGLETVSKKTQENLDLMNPKK